MILCYIGNRTRLCGVDVCTVYNNPTYIQSVGALEMVCIIQLCNNKVNFVFEHS